MTVLINILKITGIPIGSGLNGPVAKRRQIKSQHVKHLAGWFRSFPFKSTNKMIMNSIDNV